MKSNLSLLILPLVVACNGTGKDPKSVTKGDLNPPFMLQSITSNKSMILQWNISNTEDDLKGYNVYVAKKSLTEVQTALNTGIGSNAFDLTTQQIRRCDKTSALFALFGFKADSKFAKKSCDDFSVEELTAATPATAPLSSITAEADAEEGSSFVKCFASNFTTDISSVVSVDIAKAVNNIGAAIPTDLKQRVGATVRCEIPATSKLSDGTEGFVNGTEYTAFVIAVIGDKANKISYTSNFVSDMPTQTVKSDVNLNPGKLMTSNLYTTAATAAAGVASAWGGEAACSAATTGTDLCKIGNYSAPAANDGTPRLILSEDVQLTTDRVFIAGEANKVYLIKREARNSINNKPGIFKPGDSPLSYLPNTALYETGKNFTALPGDLYDFVVKIGTDISYGKIFFDAVTLSDPTAAPGDRIKAVTTYVSLQTTPNSPFYALK